MFEEEPESGRSAFRATREKCAFSGFSALESKGTSSLGCCAYEFACGEVVLWVAK